jgi:hypothetical protein
MALTLHGTVSDNTVVLDRRYAKPLIINGDMAVDQRNSGASVTAVNNAYQVDRWRTFSGAASKFTVQQQTSVIPPFFKNAQKITSSSAYSAAAGEAFALNTPIEGGSIANLGFGTANAKYVTFSGSLFNSAFNRSYPFTYSVSSANTWTTIVVAIPGDTSGTWLTTTGTGLVVNFDIGSGSNWKGSANAWASAAYTGVAGSVSIVGTSGATFYVTGVQLEIGQFDANSIAPFQHESFGDSLLRCQRYYEKSNSASEAPNATDGAVGSCWTSLSNQDSTTLVMPCIQWKVEKRVSPTMTYYHTDGTSGQLSVQGTGRSVTATYVGETTLGRIYVASGGTHNDYVTFMFEAAAEL